ncbi:uncharacterized protein LOC120359286 [Solenopsis invicta]|uniref:uncharacterized protein LOC120359286 n=1 Tax=Solenopsis invicta TaxID=13686 RepID=UPI00193EB699|nr:uncharacterized protein LOC120359286 [Solenopsis invicta]
MKLMLLIKNDDQLITFTGINHSLLSSLTEAVILCEKKHYTNKFSNSVQDRIVLCLCKLQLNLPFSCLAVLFGLNRKSCSKNVYYMIQLLSTILKKVIYRPSKEEIMKSMPKCFENFKQTLIVLDCTEISVEKPTSLKCWLKLYSHYKGCETVKLLIGVAPSGLITFLSEAYGGRASDKTIFNQSKIIDKMDATRDAIMVDKGFNIKMECLENNVQLIIPPKLGQNTQLNTDKVAHTNKIAAARVHVERAIQRFKMFKIVKCKISWTLIPYIDDICTIIAGLTNLKNPILADDKF